MIAIFEKQILLLLNGIKLKDGSHVISSQYRRFLGYRLFSDSTILSQVSGCGFSNDGGLILVDIDLLLNLSF